jgi:hypothetical protein
MFFQVTAMGYFSVEAMRIFACKCDFVEEVVEHFCIEQRGIQFL